jgi:hypothetical protein
MAKIAASCAVMGDGCCYLFTWLCEWVLAASAVESILQMSPTRITPAPRHDQHQKEVVSKHVSSGVAIWMGRKFSAAYKK